MASTVSEPVQLPRRIGGIEWSTLGLDHAQITGCQTLQDEKKRSVYRLEVDAAGATSLVLKRSPSDEAAREVLFYRDVLPRLGAVPTLRLWGVSPGQSGETWMLMEDAGGQPYDWQSPLHRRLAGAWLGQLHSRGVEFPRSDLDLRDRGPVHFGSHLLTGQRAIDANLGNQTLSAEHRVLLSLLLDALAVTITAWPALIEECASLPQTLVHGDFKPDNFRVREVDGGYELVVFDWNEGGFGLPALDLTRFLGTDRSPAAGARAMEARFNYPVAPDQASYLAETNTVWAHLDSNLVRRIGLLGDLFRCAATLRWQAERLAYPWVEGPMEHLRYANAWLRHLVTELGL